jgi:hypothetical protein
MAWFQLDPESIANRVRSSGAPVKIPPLGMFLSRGIIGFMLVSVAGFAPWALGLGRTIGEAGLYAACAIVFIVLSGPAMHKLVIGPGSLSRFYKLFTPAFILYSIGWTVAWMMLTRPLGDEASGAIGLLAGTAAMGLMFALAFNASRSMFQIIAALFVLNALGFFIGGWAYGGIASMDNEMFGGRNTKRVIAMLSWGVCYGIGFGAGLGLAFYYCQSGVRKILDEEQNKPTKD